MDFLHAGVTQEETYKTSKAFVKGVVGGLKDLGNMALHPINNVILPVSELVYDSIILTLNHQYVKQKQPKQCLYKAMLDKNPLLYVDSATRMNKRIAGAKKSFAEFLNATPEKQIEMMSGATTTVLIPGGLISGVKYARNVAKYGTGKPNIFRNTNNVDISQPVKTYSVADVRKMTGYNELIYVYTVDNELLLSNVYQKVSGGKNMQIFHPHLAGLKPVYAAGEVIIDSGKIIEMSNFSGHYLPGGSHLPTTVTNAFQKAGYGEVNKELFQTMFNFEPKNPVKKSVSSGTESVGAAAVANGSTAEKKEETETYEEWNARVQRSNSPDFEADLMNFSGKTQGVKAAFHNLVKCAQDFHLNEEKTTREILADVSEDLREIGTLGVNLSILSSVLGGHRRTWNNVAKVSEGMLTMSSSITSILAAKSMLSLGAITGGIGLAIGALGMFSGMFGDNDDDNGLGEALQAIHQSIHAVHQAVVDMHNDMIKCFQRVEEILVVCVMGKLNEINNNLSRLERITVGGFKELHIKDLIDVCDALSKEVLGEHTLTNEEKNSYLRQLSSWIDNHSRSCIQTQLLRGDDVSADVLAEYNLVESLPAFLRILTNLIPDLVLKDVPKIPNVEILTHASEIYMIASRRPGYKPNKEVMKRVADTIALVSGVVKQLKEFYICEETCIGILTRQYNKYRLWVGQLICKARGDKTWPNAPLVSVLQEGEHKTTLMDLLNNMELRRLCIIKLSELIGEKVGEYESKQDILSKNAEYYNVTEIPKGGLKELKDALYRGFNPNIWDSWGRITHYITKNWTAEEGKKALHLLFSMHPELTMDVSGGTKQDKGDTWGSNCSSILHAMNCSKFESGVLFCANGLTISERDGRYTGGIPFVSTDMGNCYLWRDNGCGNAALTCGLVKAMNTATSSVYRDNLREAYKYYKLLESGIFPSKSTKVSIESLFLIASVLDDDWFPLNYYLHTTKTIPPLFYETVQDDETRKYLYNSQRRMIIKPRMFTHSPFVKQCDEFYKKLTEYLKAETPAVTVSEDVLLFQDMMRDFAENVQGRYSKVVKDRFTELGKAILVGDNKLICSHFNTLNALLSMSYKDKYMLSDGVNNLIRELLS